MKLNMNYMKCMHACLASVGTEVELSPVCTHFACTCQQGEEEIDIHSFEVIFNSEREREFQF